VVAVKEEKAAHAERTAAADTAAAKQEGAAHEEEPPAAVDMFYEALDGGQAQASTADVAGLLASGAMTAETQVWTEGLEDWIPLREAKEKVPSLASVPR
jgi:hypothetical protein